MNMLLIDCVEYRNLNKSCNIPTGSEESGVERRVLGFVILHSQNIINITIEEPGYYDNVPVAHFSGAAAGGFAGAASASDCQQSIRAAAPGWCNPTNITNGNISYSYLFVKLCIIL